MTRRLPWKRTGGAVNPTQPRSSPSTATTVKVQDSDGDHGDTKVRATPSKLPASAPSKGHAAKKPALVTDRTGSTSPPPEPLRESYMNEGANGDDRWRMVEDEFLATAQQFTAHLHAAEYQRLKNASKSDNAMTIKNISRPVVGRMTDLVRMKQERKARSERMRRALKKRKREHAKTAGGVSRTGSDDDDDDHVDDLGDIDGASDDSDSAGDPYSSTSLFGLMERPRKTAASLLEPTDVSAPVARPGANMPVRASSIRPRAVESAPRPTFTSIPGLQNRAVSRNSTGVVQLEEDDETVGSDEDDLDGPTPRKQRLEPAGTSKQSTSTASASSRSSSEVVAKTAAPLASKQDTVRKSKVESSSDDDDDDILAKLKNRRASHKASWDKKRQSTDRNRLGDG